MFDWNHECGETIRERGNEAKYRGQFITHAHASQLFISLIIHDSSMSFLQLERRNRGRKLTEEPYSWPWPKCLTYMAVGRYEGFVIHRQSVTDRSVNASFEWDLDSWGKDSTPLQISVSKMPCAPDAARDWCQIKLLSSNLKRLSFQ